MIKYFAFSETDKNEISPQEIESILDNYDLWLSDPIQKISVIFDLSTGEVFRITKELDSYDAFQRYRTSSLKGRTLADAQLLVRTDESNVFYLMKDNALADPLDVISKMAILPEEKATELERTYAVLIQANIRPSIPTLVHHALVTLGLS